MASLIDPLRLCLLLREGKKRTHYLFGSSAEGAGVATATALNLAPPAALIVAWPAFPQTSSLKRHAGETARVWGAGGCVDVSSTPWEETKTSVFLGGSQGVFSHA